MKATSFVLLSGMLLFVMAAADVAAAQDCFSSYATGSGATRLAFCISEHGNLADLETPAGTFHDFWDGYKVCSGGRVRAIEGPWGDWGFGGPTISQPNGPNTFPLTITRSTVDGAIQLTQAFARDTTEKDVTVTMTLTNVSATVLSDVALWRNFVASPDSGVGTWDTYYNTADSVWIVDSHAVRLTALTWATSHSTWIDTLPHPESCSPYRHFETPFRSWGDLAGVTYNLGALRPGARKTVKVLYRFQ